jgi:chloramphenicol O-acetyltransferase
MDSDIDDVIADEYSNQFNQFLNNNIGQIKEIKEDAAMTYYDITNAPAGAIFFFGNSDIIHLDFPHLEVLHRSKNKEDLKKYITANKYNL